MPTFVRIVFVLLGFLVLSAPARAQSETMPEASQCLAIADRGARIQRVALQDDQVSITYVTHSTFLIESGKGLKIATDFAGYAGEGVIPDVVTMNHAHSTHYTDFPDPAIKTVLRGWNPSGDGPARHDLAIEDVRIRNVPTDIRRWNGMVEADGNSIFIFEIAGLCIGHLGHLHHGLRPEHIAMIGRLDVVFVPVDGSYTMGQDYMVEVLQTLRARLVIPMHYFGPSTLYRFLGKLRGSNFEVETNESRSIVISAGTLPKVPKVLVLPGS